MGNAPFARLAGAAGTRARLSRDAGRYLCNYVYWRALEQVRGTRPLVQFVHIPPLTVKARLRRSKKPPTLAQLLKPAEALLIALIAASRR
jgi:pyroglutamyl-peptidase